MLDPAKVAGKIVRLRPRRDRARQQEPGRQGSRRRRHGPGQHAATNSLNADFHFVPTVHLAGHGTVRRSRPMRPRRARRRRSTQSTIVYNAPAPLTASLLLARPAARRQRRPAQARPDRARAGHPRRRRAAGQQRPAVRPLQRHVDVEPARGRSRRAVEAAAPDWSPMMIKSALMTTGYDVLDGGTPSTANPLLIFRQGAGHVGPNDGGRSGPRLRLRLQRLARLPLRHGQLAAPCCARSIHAIDPSDLNVRVDRDRRPGRLADGHAHGHERERQAR